MNKPLVSIDCITYNHENYISEAIESFISQITNFDFEILIHDDASTDKTADIIRMYEMRHPELINSIYQNENQYSKGVSVSKINFERAKGEYIAICEGDDYWIDPYKLQKQVDYMETHPECSMCVHAAYTVSDKKKYTGVIRPSEESRIFSTEEVISGGGGLFSTNSILYRAKYNKERPDFFYNAPIGDYPLAIYLSLCGTVYYMDDFLSCYRKGVINSWTWKMAKSNFDIQRKFRLRMIKMLDEVNNYSNYMYSDTISKTKLAHEFKILILNNDLSKMKSEFKDLYNELPALLRIKLHIKKYSPWLFNLLKRVRLSLISIFLKGV